MEDRKSRMVRASVRAVSLALLVTLAIGCGPSDGSHEDHYANGQVKEEGAYRDGEKTGKWTYYWQNGKKKTEAYYSKGKPAGTWVYLDDKGKVIGKGTYKKGKMWNGTFVRFIMGIPKVMVIEEGKEKGQ